MVFKVDKLLDPLQVCGQQAAVGLARWLATALGDRCFTGCAGLATCRLYIFSAKLELVGMQLLLSCTEPVTHERIDHRLEPLNFRIGLALRECQICGSGTLACHHADLFQGERTERFDVLGLLRR